MQKNLKRSQFGISPLQQAFGQAGKSKDWGKGQQNGEIF